MKCSRLMSVYVALFLLGLVGCGGSSTAPTSHEDQPERCRLTFGCPENQLYYPLFPPFKPGRSANQESTFLRLRSMYMEEARYTLKVCQRYR
jgi:hypothetical protein